MFVHSKANEFILCDVYSILIFLRHCVCVTQGIIALKKERGKRIPYLKGLLPDEKKKKINNFIFIVLLHLAGNGHTTLRPPRC